LADDHRPHRSGGDNRSGTTAWSVPDDAARFLAENDAAMTKMMRGMAVKSIGDVDRDFVAMMVPHHQGAIDMALAMLRYGRNEQLRRLAQEIIVTQQEEIAAMQLAVGERLQPIVASPTHADHPLAGRGTAPSEPKDED